MNSLKIEIQNYKDEINFHLCEAEFWKKELKKVQKLEKNAEQPYATYLFLRWLDIPGASTTLSTPRSD